MPINRMTIRLYCMRFVRERKYFVPYRKPWKNIRLYPQNPRPYHFLQNQNILYW